MPGGALRTELLMVMVVQWIANIPSDGVAIHPNSKRGKRRTSAPRWSAQPQRWHREKPGFVLVCLGKKGRGEEAAEGLSLRPPTKPNLHPKKSLRSPGPTRVSLLQLPTPGQVPAPFTLLVVVVFQWQNPRAGVRRSSLAEWEKGREIGVGLGRGRKGENILRAPINAQISNHSSGGGKKE